MSVPAESPRQQMIEILQQQPEDSTYDELLRELAFRRMVVRGLDDLESGRVVSNEDMNREMKSWQR